MKRLLLSVVLVFLSLNINAMKRISDDQDRNKEPKRFKAEFDLLSSDPTAYYNQEFIQAVRNGDLAMVALLAELPEIDPAAMDNKAFRFAIYDNNLAMVKLLVTFPGVDPSVYNNYALERSCKKNHMELINFLINLPQVDTRKAFDYAMKNNKFTLIINLLADKRCNLFYRPAEDKKAVIKELVRMQPYLGDWGRITAIRFAPSSYNCVFLLLNKDWQNENLWPDLSKKVILLWAMIHDQEIMAEYRPPLWNR